jgi:hypothetical protein
MQLQIDRPINSQKHLNFVKFSDSFVSSLGAAKTEMVRITQELHLYFMQPTALRIAAHLPLRKRRHFVVRAPTRMLVRDSDKKIRARRAAGEAVPARGDGYRERALAAARHHLRMRVIQYSRDVSD